MKTFLSKPRPYPEGNPVVAGHLDSNAALIADAARLYIPDGAYVLDTTYGSGAFWRDTDLFRFYLFANDRDREYTYEEKDAHWRAGVVDFYNEDVRHLQWPGDLWDVVVFDPPYKSGGKSSHPAMVKTYGLDALESDTPSKHGNVKVVRQLYEDGMAQCIRILKPGGLLWVKCQDMVESGKQHWPHMEIPAMFPDLLRKDLFVLVNTNDQMMRHKSQHHARKNVSYLWVFQK